MYSRKKLADVSLSGAVAVGVLALVAAVLIASTAPAASSAFAATVSDGGGIAAGPAGAASFDAVTTAGAKVPVGATAALVPAVMTRATSRVNAPAPASVKHAATRVVVASSSREPAKRPAHRAASVVVGPGGWRTTVASWYGPGSYGQRLPGGVILTPKSMVLAHRTLPFGTRVAIKYHGRTCIGVVMDRGPFIHGRDFDLGPGVAKALHFDGVGKIQYKVL